MAKKKKKASKKKAGTKKKSRGGKKAARKAPPRRKARRATPLTERNLGADWSASDVAQLRQMVGENTPTRVIGLKLGRTEESVYSKASELGLSLKPVNQSPMG